MLFRKHAAEDGYGITAGQRFRARGATPVVWEVAAVYRHPWEVIPHVRLQRVDAPADMKTIALATLQDERYFAPASA